MTNIGKKILHWHQKLEWYTGKIGYVIAVQKSIENNYMHDKNKLTVSDCFTVPFTSYIFDHSSRFRGLSRNDTNNLKYVTFMQEYGRANDNSHCYAFLHTFTCVLVVSGYEKYVFHKI